MPENITKSNANGYDFAELRFCPGDSKLICLKTHKEIFLRRNLSEFLLLLLKKPRETVEYGEFCNNVKAWTIYKDVAQVMRTIHTTKGELVKNLRLLREDFNLIEAVPAKGYRLSADVAEFFENAAQPKTLLEKNAESELSFIETNEVIFAPKFFGAHFWQAFFASAIYAALFVVALFIEIAYRFDVFKSSAFKLTIPIFLWVWLSSIAGLFCGRKMSKKSAFSGFVVTAASFLCAAILLYFALGAFLPADPITEANFQTYPAHAAYLKNVFYFTGLGIFLIALPFVVIARLENEVAENDKKVVASLRRLHHRRLSIVNALMLSPLFLLALTIIALLVSLLLTAHLFDNLKPNPHLNLFMQLVLWRWFLYFALAAECLIWYRFSLNSLKAHCLKTTS